MFKEENKWAIACWLCMCVSAGGMWGDNPISGISLSFASLFYLWDRLGL